MTPHDICIAIKTDSKDTRCGGIADYPLVLKDGSRIPLCWQHAQMIISGWYYGSGWQVDGDVALLRLFKSGCYPQS